MSNLRDAATGPVLATDGGPKVIAHLMLSRLGLALSVQQCDELWSQCKAQLEAESSPKIVQEVQESQTGRLDTFPRGYVLDAIGRVLTAQAWPCNGSSDREQPQFRSALRLAIRQRGYASDNSTGSK